eukprot:gene10941-biopygen5270
MAILGGGTVEVLAESLRSPRIPQSVQSAAEARGAPRRVAERPGRRSAAKRRGAPAETCGNLGNMRKPREPAETAESAEPPETCGNLRKLAEARRGVPRKATERPETRGDLGGAPPPV